MLVFDFLSPQLFQIPIQTFVTNSYIHADVSVLWPNVTVSCDLRLFIHPSILIRGREPIPATMGQEAGYILDRSPVFHRAST